MFMRENVLSINKSDFENIEHRGMIYYADYANALSRLFGKKATFLPHHLVDVKNYLGYYQLVVHLAIVEENKEKEKISYLIFQHGDIPYAPSLKYLYGNGIMTHVTEEDRKLTLVNDDYETDIDVTVRNAALRILEKSFEIKDAEGNVVKPKIEDIIPDRNRIIILSENDSKSSSFMDASHACINLVYRQTKSYTYIPKESAIMNCHFYECKDAIMAPLHYDPWTERDLGINMKLGIGESRLTFDGETNQKYQDLYCYFDIAKINQSAQLKNEMIPMLCSLENDGTTNSDSYYLFGNNVKIPTHGMIGDVLVRFTVTELEEKFALKFAEIYVEEREKARKFFTGDLPEMFKIRNPLKMGKEFSKGEIFNIGNPLDRVVKFLTEFETEFENATNTSDPSNKVLAEIVARQTGRTTRMLSIASMFAKQGISCCVVFPNETLARHTQERHEDMFSAGVEGNPRFCYLGEEIDGVSLIPANFSILEKSGKYVYLYDHSVYELMVKDGITEPIGKTE